jgi:hypothetical protein
LSGCADELVYRPDILTFRGELCLARWLGDTNNRDEARATLTENYNWFTEGFDTADLMDARAVIDELS